MGVDFASPVDGKYLAMKWVDQPFWGEHFSLASRKENMEIKILFKPELLSHPHVNSVRWITQIASNDEETAISYVPLTEERTKALYGADWAKVFFFKPKISLSPYSETKMIALYKEEVGMVFVFFLSKQFTILSTIQVCLDQGGYYYIVMVLSLISLAKICAIE